MAAAAKAEKTSAETELDEAELQAIKVKLRSLMQTASESGKLVEALATISKNQIAAERSAPNAGELDEIKVKLRRLMHEAQESGELSKALEKNYCDEPAAGGRQGP